MSSFQILLTPIIALLSLAFLFSTVLRHLHGTRFEQIAFGMLFGTVAVVGMLNPIVLGDGIIFDPRTLLVGAATAYAGMIAGAIAMCFAMICRVYLGGMGVLPGVLSLVLAYGLTLFAMRLMRGRITSQPLRDAILSLFITSAVVSIFVLPREIALGILDSIFGVLVTSNFVGMIAIGFVFRRELRHAAAERLLEQVSQRDPLTNLLNRRGLDAAVSAKRTDSGKGHAMLYFDIDNFKQINDGFGHDAGDAALSAIAARIGNSLRKEAIFARHGGDEFSVYMRSVAAEDVEGIAERLCNTISGEPVEHDGHRFDLTISVGGFWSAAPRELDAMINAADKQLGLAKTKGKNRAEVAYAPEAFASAA